VAAAVNSTVGYQCGLRDFLVTGGPAFVSDLLRQRIASVNRAEATISSSHEKVGTWRDVAPDGPGSARDRESIRRPAKFISAIKPLRRATGSGGRGPHMVRSTGTTPDAAPTQA